MSVFCTVEKLKNEKYNPILIFKLQKSNTVFGPSYLDSLPNHENSFALGFQTEAQKEMLLKHSHKILCIDATHGTNHYDFFLLSLHIQDEYGQGYPVAHFITNVLDFQTLLALFHSLRCRVPDLKVNTVITDDDSISFQAFNSVFGPNIKHLLCQWHVYNAWKRQLLSKVHDKSHRDKMLEELLKIMYENSSENFDNRLSVFLNDYSNKWQKFTDYFVKNYSARKTLWATCFRQFPHGYTNTNNYCESFHSQLKTVYFDRKYNRRIDELISTLLNMEIDRFLKYSNNVANNVPTKSYFAKTIKEKHDMGVKIPNNNIIKQDDHWLVKSQAVKQKVFTVRKVTDVCLLFDHCSSKCSEINCAALCSHLYRCSCQDSSNLCKHIHKVRLVDSGFKTCITDNYYEGEIGENVSGIDPKILNLELNNISSATESFCSKEVECKKLCSELLELIKIPRVKEVMLTDAISCLNTLVAGMRGIVNHENIPVSVAPKLYVAPNQKIPPQNNFFKTSQRNKRKKFFLGESSKKKRQQINEKNVDDPDNSIEQEVPLKSSGEISNCVSSNVFNKLNRMNVNNPTATIVTINNINLSFYMLKCLDPFITLEEENYLKYRVSHTIELNHRGIVMPLLSALNVQVHGIAKKEVMWFLREEWTGV
ncbi:hypothetical protein AVEN_58168-1 [Araneus ventricosus]|uniref:MULE transposase domain-containing protein n=1 Tax=Araneus ventricosus TaxID=182803 RepID=A0A4Y2V8X5_ARAVE|nr:hypothetical protein AVEN_58168-1 [Araneus ventricosus]